ncbi:MAG TPA: adenylate kinase family protein [Nitrososphaerales archaeon]|nr:adenylate kinase family protein [Nitrososphaerales archaeon]
MRGIVGVCGTPGTGKKTLAPKVAKLLHLPSMSLTSFAPKGVSEVDTIELRRKLRERVSGSVVLYGHLLPHVLTRREASFVAVLRCDPSVLRERLTRRGYPSDKVRENVEAELIGVVLDECVKRFGPSLVREYDTTSASPHVVARAIARDSSGERRPTSRVRWIDWTLAYGSSSKLRSLLEGPSDPPAST